VLTLKEQLRNASEKENKKALQHQIREKKKAAAEFEKREKTKLKTQLGILTNTRKNVLKNKAQSIAKMRKHFAKTLKDKNARTNKVNKSISKERNALRQESRDEQHLQDNMLADVVLQMLKNKERIGKKADQDYKQNLRDQKQVLHTKKAQDKKNAKTRKRHARTKN